VTDSDPGFVDMSNDDFTLKEDSVVFTQLPDFKPIPFVKIGLIKGAIDEGHTN